MKNKCPYASRCDYFTFEEFTCNNEWWECGTYKHGMIPSKKVK